MRTNTEYNSHSPKMAYPSDLFQYTVTVESAEELDKGDIFGLSDPYVIVSVGSCTQQTTVLHKTLNPEFHQEFVFFVDSPQEIKFEVIDWDKGKKHDSLGTASIPFSRLKPK